MLDKIKILLGLPVEEHVLDEKLNIILDAAENRLKLLLGGIEVPPQMEYILVDVSAIRFNKIGSEGLSSHTVEGESLSFAEDDFANYRTDIQAYLDTQKDAVRGKVRFL